MLARAIRWLWFFAVLIATGANWEAGEGGNGLRDWGGGQAEVRDRRFKYTFRGVGRKGGRKWVERGRERQDLGGKLFNPIRGAGGEATTFGNNERRDNERG